MELLAERHRRHPELGFDRVLARHGLDIPEVVLTPAGEATPTSSTTRAYLQEHPEHSTVKSNTSADAAVPPASPGNRKTEPQEPPQQPLH